MKKEEVELIIIGVNLANEQALNMKIYKDGTVCRSGCGGLPSFAISGMTIQGKNDFFGQLIPLIDPQIIENPINYEEENIKTPLEYFMAFYGASSNGETGEQAEWTKTSGVRFLLDNETQFRHPLLGFLDAFVVKAADVTNSWFFDIVMTAVYNLKPVDLEKTFVTVPKTEEERQEALSRYVNQITANAERGWDIVKIGNERQFKTKDGIELRAAVEDKSGVISINFYEFFDTNNLDSLTKRLSEIEANGNMATPQSDFPPLTDKKSGKKWWEFWK
jgi:hypothetical protein